MASAKPDDLTPLEWEVHFLDQRRKDERNYTLDMEDGPEEALLSQCGYLFGAVAFLNGKISDAYAEADALAMRHQKTHKWLARLAIVGGALAVGSAIVQLALLVVNPGLAKMAAAFEGVAAGLGLLAVIFGLRAKMNCRWFIQRHIAERLRMLKFQAFGRAEFWSGDMDGWKDWVRVQGGELMKLAGMKPCEALKVVKEWARGGEGEPDEPPPPACPLEGSSARAVVSYYRGKRADFQAEYFQRQSVKFEAESHWLHRLGFPIFVLSMVAVAGHFIVEQLAHGNHAAHVAGVWLLALAALLPVGGLALRAWLGAFERSRNANIYQAKHQALEKCSARLRRDGADCAATMHHIAHVEHFLENEHRGWLHLLLDAEWFL